SLPTRRSSDLKKTVTLQIHLTFSIPAVEDIVLIQVLEAGVELAAQTVVVNTDIRTEFLIQNPKLWWPNGYGEQPLYQIKVQHFNGEGILLEEIEKNIGLRTLTVSRDEDVWGREFAFQDRKSTRLNSSHVSISYAVFCLKKK